jgi:hypothetical protein
MPMNVSWVAGVSAAALGGFAAGGGDAAGGPSAVGSLAKRQPIRRRGKLPALSLDELSARVCASSTFKAEIAKKFLILHKCLHLLKFINHV